MLQAMLLGCSLLQAEDFKDPGRNKLVWVSSPNFGPRPKDAPIDTIVLHHTAASTLISTVRWFAMERSQVSAHFTIGKDGSIVQHVSTFDRAWHAGVSRDRNGRSNVNDFSIGIEMVNSGKGDEPWTKEQVEVVHNLVAHLIKRRFPEIKQITSHEYIARPDGRKNDPLNFPWEQFADLGVDLVYGHQKD